jgi:hypothetical protein
MRGHCNSVLQYSDVDQSEKSKSEDTGESE